MSNSPEQNDAENQNESGSIRRNERLRRFLIYGAALLVVFLLGLVPMWLKARECARQRDAALGALRVSNLQNSLANAAIDARQGRYEPARRAASDFFTNLQSEMDRGRDSVFTEAQQNSLRPVFDTRDETITLLARSDPASADRLVDLHNKYRQATAAGTPPG